MFKGTKELAPGEFSRIVKTLGGRGNAFTSQDYTAYFQSIAAEHLETVMKMEADRMQNLNPPLDHFKSEKNVVLEERRQVTENDPRGLFTEQMRNALFINHPYGTPVIGWMNEIERYEWDDVKAFYDRWYAPNNAILIVSGDITAEKLKPMAEEIYGRIPAKNIPERERSEIPAGIGKTYLSLEHDIIRQPILRRFYLAPSYANNKSDSLALQVLEEIMSGGPTTRLYRSLVVEKKAATSISFFYGNFTKDIGMVGFGATPSEGTSLQDLEALIEEELEMIAQTGPTEEEVKNAIQRLQDAAIFSRDSVSGPAMIFGYSLVLGSTVEEVESWPDAIAEITAEDVQRVAAKYLNLDDPWIRLPVTGYMLPKAEKGVESANE